MTHLHLTVHWLEQDTSGLFLQVALSMALSLVQIPAVIPNHEHTQTIRCIIGKIFSNFKTLLLNPGGV